MASNPKKGFADKKMIGRAISDSFIKLNPKTQAQNPVMLLVYISAILTTILWIIALCGLKDASAGYTLAIAIIHSQSNQKFLQDAIVSQRSGRFVVPVKAEFRGEMPGVIPT